MLLRVKELAICDIYLRTFLVYHWEKKNNSVMFMK